MRGGSATVASWALAVAMAGAVASFAAPIRVGIFTGSGPGVYSGTNYHTAANAIVSILARPDTAGIGPNLVIPPGGAIATRYGLVTGNGTPTQAQAQAFIDALDTLDVAVFIQNLSAGNIFTNTLHRSRIESFSKTRGIVSVAMTTDSYGIWPAWDSLHGARFQTFPPAARNATLHLDTLNRQDASWRFLNGGLPDTVRFLENWFSFTTNGDVIRAVPGLKVSVRVDENSYENGMGGARAMGEDHPLSWYRHFSEGGRFFYTSIGYRAQTYLNNGGSPSTPFLRRQLYNAILWAAGVDSNGVVSVRGNGSGKVAKFSDAARVGWSGGSLRITTLGEGAHSVEVRTLEGRLVASRRGAGRTEHRFDRLPAGSMLVVTVKSKVGHATKLVTAP